jgi:hypothetical protein
MAELEAATVKSVQPTLQPAAGAAAHTLGAHIDDAREPPELPPRPPSARLSRSPSLVPGSVKEAEAAIAALPYSRLPSDVASRLPEDRSRREHTLTDASRSSLLPLAQVEKDIESGASRAASQTSAEVLSLLILPVQTYKY